MATSPQRKYHLSAVHAPAPTSPLRFVISDCPDPSSLPEYVVALTRAAPTVRHLVRLSASVAGGAHAYDSAPLVAAGISVHDWAAFDDGGVPSAAQVAKWIAFLATLVVAAVAEDASEAPVVAVHCVSGIGRAPLLVALATVESGIDALDAVSSVRALRRGALNNVQVRWLADYRPKKTLADLKRARKAAATYSEDADDNENDSAVPPPSTSCVLEVAAAAMDTSGELLTPTLHRLAVLPLSQSRRHVRLTFRRGHHIMPAMAATADHLPLFPRARISDTLGGTLVACAAHGDKAALQWCFDQYSTHRHPEWRSFFPRVAASAAVAGHRSVLEWMRDVAAPAIVMGHRDLDSKVDENLWDTAVGAISLESVVRAGQIETAWWCLDQFQWQKGQTTWHRQQWTWIAPRRRRIDAILSMVRGAASGGHLDLIDQCVAAVSDAADADSVAHDPDLDTDAVVDQTTNVVWVHALMSAAFAGQVPVLEHYMVTATSPIAPRHLVLIGDAALSGGHVSAADWCWDHLTHHQSGQQRAFCTQVGVYRAMHVSGRPMMDWIWDRTHGTAETMQGIDAEGNPVDIQWTSPVTSGLFDCTITVATLDWWLAASIANQWPMDPWLRSLVGQACRWDRPDVLDWLWSHQHHCSIEANMSGRGGLIGYELERHMVHAPKSTAMLDWYWTHREELGTPRIMDRVGGHLELALKSHDGRAGELLDWWIDKFGPEDRHLKAAVANAHRMASGRVLAWVMRAPAPVSDMAATDEELVARFVAGPSAAVSDLWLQYMLSTRTPTSLPWPCSAGFTAAATRRPISIERLDWWLAYNLSPSLGSEYDPLTTTRSMVRDTFPAAFENAMLSSHPAVGWWVDTMLRFGLPFVCSERTQLSRPIIQQMQAQGIVFYRKVEDEVVEWKDE